MHIILLHVWPERVQMKHCKYLCVVYNEHRRDIVLKYVLVIVNSTYVNERVDSGGMVIDALAFVEVSSMESNGCDGRMEI